MSSPVLRKLNTSRHWIACALIFGVVGQAAAASVEQACGTHGMTSREQMFLHRQAMASGRAKQVSRQAVSTASTDIGDLAVVENVNGVVSTPNPFRLAQRSILFTPVDGAASAYRYRVANDAIDPSAVSGGALLRGLGDDDSRMAQLPFAFPFHGKTYTQIFVNSDGNLTFRRAEPSSDRSLGTFTAGPPRIAPLFADLNPAQSPQGVFVFSSPDKWVATWQDVPVYSASGTGASENFQVTLFPDGRILFAFATASIANAVTGITPGGQSATALVSFTSGDSTNGFATGVAERFASQAALDVVTAAQSFYLNHEDAYDYLVFFNTLGVAAASGAVAFETTVRNQYRSGYGDVSVDNGTEYGSARRLQAVLNMGPVSQYPVDPNGRVLLRGGTGDTPLTLLGHETGHLFLAYVSVRDGSDPASMPMLNPNLAHWSFLYDSEASLLEGNRILDQGVGANPRFVTTATVSGYSPLDQYLMGLLPPSEVAPTFLVTASGPGAPSAATLPKLGVAFNGQRRDISVDQLTALYGPRLPDQTVAQRNFRFAFVIVTGAGQVPSAAVVQQVETYRAEFPAAFARFTGARATAETTLRKAVQLSLGPASGVVLGSNAPASIRLQQPAAADLDFAVTGVGTVRIPRGASEASFAVSGTEVGVRLVTATPADPVYETAAAYLQTSPLGALRLTVDSGDRQPLRSGPLPEPITFRVSDANLLPYAGVTVRVAASGGTAQPDAVLTDQGGLASFVWTPGPGPLNELTGSIEGSASQSVATAVGAPFAVAGSVVNAASFVPGLSPGGIATLFGANLTGAGDGSTVQLTVDGQPATVFYQSPRQINFLVPFNLPRAQAIVGLKTSEGSLTPLAIPVLATQPGIFFDSASGYGAVLVNRTGTPTQQTPAQAGDILQVYATGLGALAAAGDDGLSRTVLPVTTTVGGKPATVLFSGQAPGFPGLYQVNVVVPAGLPNGRAVIQIGIGGSTSNPVDVAVGDR